MAEILGMAGVFGFIDDRGGLIIARKAGGEAEILTLAVAPGSRRLGIARALVEQAASAAGDVTWFLEVAAGNTPALALYGRLGFAECGRRHDYYSKGQDALTLRR